MHFGTLPVRSLKPIIKIPFLSQSVLFSLHLCLLMAPRSCVMKLHLLHYKERRILGYFGHDDLFFLSPLLLLFSAFIWLGVLFSATPPKDMTDMNVPLKE